MAITYYSDNSEREQLNPDIYFMRQALAEAEKALQRDEVPIGAVVVCQGRIIARGHNLTETLTDLGKSIYKHKHLKGAGGHT